MPPITLTRPQFLATQKKKGIKDPNYQAYLNYIKAARVKPPTMPPSSAKPPGQPLPTLESLLRLTQSQLQTPAQMEAQARRMSQIGIDAQMKMIREEAAQMRNEARMRAEAMAAAGRAAAQMNAGLFDQVGGEYNAAAQEMRGMATGMAGGAGGITAADVAGQNASLANIGAPALAEGGAMGAPSVAGGAQTHVESYRGGEIPGQALGTAGEAAEFGLAGLVSSQNLRATQEGLAAWRQSVGEIDANRRTAVKELMAGRPAAMAAFLQQLQDAQRQSIALTQGLLGARAATQAQKAAQKSAAAAVKRDLAQIDPLKSKAAGFVVTKGNQFYLVNGKKVPYSVLEALTPEQQTAADTAAAAAARAKKDAQIAWDKVDIEASLVNTYLTDMEGDPIVGPDGKRIKTKDYLKKLRGAKGGTTKDPKAALREHAEKMAKGQALVDALFEKQAMWPEAMRRLKMLGFNQNEATNLLRLKYKPGRGNSPFFSESQLKQARKQMGQPKLAVVMRVLNKRRAEIEALSKASAGIDPASPAGADYAKKITDLFRRIDLILDDVLHHGGKNIDIDLPG